MMKNFCGRLHTAVQGVMPKNVHGKITLLAPANRHISAWVGGSVITELEAFDKMWITKQQYQEGDKRLSSANCM